MRAFGIVVMPPILNYDLSIRKIHEQMGGKVSRYVIGEIVKQVRVRQPAA